MNLTSAERAVCQLGDDRDRVDDHRDVQLQPELVESIFDFAHRDEPNRLDVESALESHPDRERGKTALANESSEGGSGMEAQIGDNIVFESERVGQPAHSGVIEEVLKQQPPRYRIRWEDGHESIVAPAAGAARIEPKKRPAKR